MNTIVITKKKRYIIAVLFKEWQGIHSVCKCACDIKILSEETPSFIGNIYVGHVRDVAKNIEAAFVEIGKEKMGYLMLKNAHPIFLTNKNTDKVCEGDRVIVQVTKDAIKTKDAVVTTNFSLSGRYIVLTHGKTGLVFSSKIKDTAFKEQMTQIFSERTEGKPYGFLIRTEGYSAADAEILEEADKLLLQYQTIIALARTRQKHFLLHQGEGELVRFVKEQLKTGEETEIVTDSRELFQEFQPLLPNYVNLVTRIYQDELLPLYKLYRLENILEEAYAKKVWLKSGAYLWIEYTEALTVVDVNTGKCESGKNKQATFSAINKEAVLEIARQVRLRNLSGIIIVDFIDMDQETQTKELFEFAKKVFAKDSVKTTVVDITKLHLMEITRKKTTDRIPFLPDLFKVDCE